MVARVFFIALLALGLTACRGSVAAPTAAVRPTPPRETATGATLPAGPPLAMVTAAPLDAAPTARIPSGTPTPYPTPQLPVGCDEDGIRLVVKDFIDAFNRGDQAGLSRVFPAKGSDGDHPWTGDPEQLRWFTLVRANPSKGVNALNLYTREALLAYFAERHAQHERMRLVELVVNTAGGSPGAPAINFRIARAADDLPEDTFPGKGGVSCTHGVIFLWSQGGGPYPSSP